MMMMIVLSTCLFLCLLFDDRLTACAPANGCAERRQPYDHRLRSGTLRSRRALEVGTTQLAHTLSDRARQIEAHIAGDRTHVDTERVVIDEGFGRRENILWAGSVVPDHDAQCLRILETVIAFRAGQVAYPQAIVCRSANGIAGTAAMTSLTIPCSSTVIWFMTCFLSVVVSSARRAPPVLGPRRATDRGGVSTEERQKAPPPEGEEASLPLLHLGATWCWWSIVALQLVALQRGELKTRQ